MTQTDRRQLFEQHQGWALGVALWQCRRLHSRVRRNEIESAALEGLWDAAGRWDEQRPFRTYAAWRIKGAISDYLRRLYPRGTGRCDGRKVRTRQLSGELDLADPRPALAAVEELDEINRLLRPLNKRQRWVLCQYVLEGRLMREIAADLERTESRVSEIISESLAKLRAFWSQHPEEVSR